jgi:hypothetical protein
MSLDNQALFDIDPSVGQEFRDSFISQLDFEKATNFTSQEACQQVTLSLSLSNAQEREAIVYLLKN